MFLIHALQHLSVQPLPDILPAPLTQQTVDDPLFHIPLYTPQIEEPTIYNTHASGYSKDPPPSPPDYCMAKPSSATEDLSNYSPPSPGLSLGLGFYDLLVDQPPLSILPSEASPAPASDSDLPSSVLPSEASSALASDSDIQPSSFTKATKQTNLLGFFPKVPAEVVYTKWWKRKRENEVGDKEEYAERKQKDEAEKLQKLTNKRTMNQISQKKQQDRIKEEKAALSGSSVSLLGYILQF